MKVTVTTLAQHFELVFNNKLTKLNFIKIKLNQISELIGNLSVPNTKYEIICRTVPVGTYLDPNL